MTIVSTQVLEKAKIFSLAFNRNLFKTLIHCMHMEFFAT
eukprot:UN11491